MYFTSLDLEMTGKNVHQDRVIEIGYSVWNWPKIADIPHLVCGHSELVVDGDILERDPWEWEYQECGITYDMLHQTGLESSSTAFQEFLDTLVHFANKGVVVAHNGMEFDKPMLDAFLVRNHISMADSISSTWVDTRIDVPYPESCRYRNLLYLAAYHGFVNPFPHRALFDSVTAMKVMSNYNPWTDNILNRAETPIVEVMAEAPFEMNDLIKQAGFHWESEDKLWIQNMRLWEADRLDLGFKTVVLDPPIENDI